MTKIDIFKTYVSNTKSSEYNKLAMINMAPVFDEFDLLLNKINEDSYRYFINLMKEKETFNIDNILYDILTSMDLYKIALKHKEPIEIIKLIKDGNYNKKLSIVGERFYTALELTKIFNLTKSYLTNHMVFNNIKLNKNKTVGGNIMYVYGYDYINIINKIVTKDNVIIDKNGNQYVSITDAANEINVPYTWFRNRIRSDKEIFDVEISPRKDNIDIRNRLKLYSLDKVLLAKRNKINYIEKDKFDLQRGKISSLHKLLTSSLLHLQDIESEHNTKNFYIKKSIAIAIINMDKKVKEMFLSRTSITRIKYAIPIMEENIKESKIKGINYSKFKSLFLYIINKEFTGDNIFGIKVNCRQSKMKNRISKITALKIYKKYIETKI